MSSSNPQLNFVVALMSEARPIIDHYSLIPKKLAGMTIYQAERKHSNLNLLITGIGRVPMATHVGWLAGACPATRKAWLNVGTAGHRSLATGTVVRVAHCDKVFAGRALYPPLVARWRGELGSLVTADQPTSNYPEQALVDMEGDAFFASALKFSPAELVQSLKVVSDNAGTDLAQLNGAVLTKHVQRNIAEISEFADALIDLASEQPPEDPTLRGFLNEMARVKMTTSQRVKLVELAQHLQNLGHPLQRFPIEARDKKGVAKLLSDMQSALHESAPALK